MKSGTHRSRLMRAVAVDIDSRPVNVEHKMSQGTSDDKFQGVKELMIELMSRVDKQDEEILALKKENLAHEKFIQALKMQNRDLKMKKLAK